MIDSEGELSLRECNRNKDTFEIFTWIFIIDILVLVLLDLS